MDAMWDHSDDSLMEELKEAVAEPTTVPDQLIEAAKAAFIWRGVDEELELLSLSYDSSSSDASLVRGPALAAQRMLVFESANLTMEFELGGKVLMGQVVPAGPGRVTLENSQGPVDETEADSAGFFLLSRPAAGPVRLKWHTQHARAVTEWVPI